jgi:hypothetical protein
MKHNIKGNREKYRNQEKEFEGIIDDAPVPEDLVKVDDEQM